MKLQSIQELTDYLTNTTQICVFVDLKSECIIFANSLAKKTYPELNTSKGKIPISNLFPNIENLLTLCKDATTGPTSRSIFQSSSVSDTIVSALSLANLENSFENIYLLQWSLNKKQNPEENLIAFFATMNNGLMIVDPKGIVQEVAPNFKFLFFQINPLNVGDLVCDILPESQQSTLLNALSQCLQQHKPIRLEFESELLDELKTFEIKCMPIRKEERYLDKILLVFSDITDAKRLDQQLIESMKFVSLGELAAGLAHEINNPLQSALLYLDELISIDNIEPAEQKSILKKIESANLRIRDLVRSLLDLGRVESPKRDLVSPYYILVRTSELVEVSCRKKNIEFTRFAGPNLPGIFVRWQEIEQVLINCVVNSINALAEMENPPEKPKIEMGIEIETLNSKDWIVFSVTDNGPGIDEKIIEKVFLPLFTTRRNRQGTGLGLSISKKIISEHGGDILLKTKLGIGTRVEIYLPVALDINV